MWIKQTMGEQRKLLTAAFEPPMLRLAKRCVEVWSNVDKLDQELLAHVSSIPYCHLLYAIDKLGKQVSSNVNANSMDPSYRGQDLSRRPFSVSLYPKRAFMLSSVYISKTTGRPCLSAVQPVMSEQQFFGFVVADFDIRHLPLPSNSARSATVPSQKKTNGNSRQYSQARVPSVMDQHLEEILNVLSTLINEHGVFHCTLHCSSEQAMLWQLDEPYQYHLYRVEQLLEPDICLHYPRRPYPPEAILTSQQVEEVLERFRLLRLSDERVYLRAGSVNIFNGMVGLSFSCEGSQYLPAEVFLSKDLSTWLGDPAIIGEVSLPHSFPPGAGKNGSGNGMS